MLKPSYVPMAVRKGKLPAAGVTMDYPDDPAETDRELLEFLGEYDALVYAAVKQGRVAELAREGQCLAKAIQDHLGLPHIHNALEFADVRGAEYVVDGVSPMAHLRMHAAVEGMLSGGNEDVKAAFDKLLATGISRHHAIHIIGAIFMEFYFDATRDAERNLRSDKALRKFVRSLRKLCTDSSFRRKMVRRFGEGHGFAKPIGEEP
jgi:hypothetical protein